MQVTGRYDKSSGKRPSPEWRIMNPGEMSEFKHLSVRLEKEDWGCLHCWKNNAVAFADVTWTSVKLHLKEKYANISPTFSWTPNSDLSVGMTSTNPLKMITTVRGLLSRVIFS